MAMKTDFESMVRTPICQDITYKYNDNYFREYKKSLNLVWITHKVSKSRMNCL